jgi:hypothetical protein
MLEEEKVAKEEMAKTGGEAMMGQEEPMLLNTLMAPMGELGEMGLMEAMGHQVGEEAMEGM